MTFVYSDTFCFHQLFNSHSLSVVWLIDSLSTPEIFSLSIKDSRLCKLKSNILGLKLADLLHTFPHAFTHGTTALSPPAFTHLTKTFPFNLETLLSCWVTALKDLQNCNLSVQLAWSSTMAYPSVYSSPSVIMAITWIDSPLEIVKHSLSLM